MKRILAIVLLWSMLPMVAFSAILKTHYADTRPREASPSVGRIYPLNVHGTIVYLTRGEDVAAKWIFWGGMLCGLVGGYLWQDLKHKK